MLKEQKGSMVVETILAFIPFTLLIISILSLINISTTQARVHNAITQAVNTVSTYAYVLSVTGIVDGLENSASVAESVASENAEILSQLESVMNSAKALNVSETVEQGQAAADRIYEYGQNIIEDPMGALSTVANVAINEAQQKIFEVMIRPLVGAYLSHDGLSGDQYLLNANVVDGLQGIDFESVDILDFTSTESNDSYFVDSNGDIKIVASYEIEYKFGALPMPFDTNLKVTQVVKTKLLLSGYGETYADIKG